jgi:ketosteroid isomerase-like protein
MKAALPPNGSLGSGGVMAKESTSRDPVELTRQRWEAASRSEFDLQTLADDYSLDAVMDTAGYGMGTFQGREAISGFLSDWISSFEDLTMEAEEIAGLGNGVVLVVYHQQGRPLGGTNHVRVRSALVAVWVGALIVRTTIYPDPDEARAAAERLADERG